MIYKVGALRCQRRNSTSKGAQPKLLRSGLSALSLLTLLFAAGPAGAAQLQEVALPAYSAEAGTFVQPQPDTNLPPAGAPNFHLVLPGILTEPAFAGTDPDVTVSSVGTTLWSGEGGAGLHLNLAVSEEEHFTAEDGKKRYTAIFAFDQPLGFQTALVVDLLRKDKSRPKGEKAVKLLQIGLSRPFMGSGTATAGAGVILSGLKPQLRLGVQFSIPLGGP